MFGSGAGLQGVRGSTPANQRDKSRNLETFGAGRFGRNRRCGLNENCWPGAF